MKHPGTTTRSIAVALAAGLAVVGLAAVGSAPSALAATGSDTGGTTPGESSGPVEETRGSCSLYANRFNFGMDCTVATGDALSIREILAGDPLPRCWHERLPEEIASEYADAAQGQQGPGAFWLRTCMSGIDPETLTITGPIRFVRTVVWLAEDAQKITLTENQRRLVATRMGTLEAPMVLTSPVVRPRVGQDIAFYVRPTRASADDPTVIGPIGYTGPGLGSVEMRARLIHLEVYPQPGERVGCDGAGIEVLATDTRATQPRACWWRYTRSSATQASRTYLVRGTAYWQIEYDTGTGWQAMAVYGRQSITGIPVTEIQTLVVP